MQVQVQHQHPAMMRGIVQHQPPSKLFVFLTIIFNSFHRLSRTNLSLHLCVRCLAFSTADDSFMKLVCKVSDCRQQTFNSVCDNVDVAPVGDGLAGFTNNSMIINLLSMAMIIVMAETKKIALAFVNSMNPDDEWGGGGRGTLTAPQEVAKTIYSHYSPLCFPPQHILNNCVGFCIF